ncbi:unnamed protein product [Brassica oleracea var. botrytis]
MLTGPIPDTFTNLDYTFTFLSNNYLTSEVPLFVLNSRAMLVIVATNINPKMVGRQRHWSFIGRTTPERRTDSSFACVQCDSAHAVGALRYRIEMDIADDTAEGFFERHTASHQTFTITRIFDERDRVPLPDFVDNGGYDDDGGDMPGDNPIPAKILELELKKMIQSLLQSKSVKNVYSLVPYTMYLHVFILPGLYHITTGSI